MTNYRMGTAVVLVAGLLMGAAAASTAWAQSDVAAKVTAAKTAADHEALAAEYDKQAAAAKAGAAEHRRMGEAYKGSTTFKSSAGNSMPQHCASLAKSFDEQAKMYEAMAEAERALAKSSK